MAKQQYKFNKETLTYEEVKLSTGKKILRVSLWLAPNIVIILLLAFIFSRNLPSHRELVMKLELERYERELQRLNKDMELVNQVLDDIEKRDEDMYRVALHAKAFPAELRTMGAGGSDKYAYLTDVSNSELLISTSQKIDKLERRLNAQSISFKELVELAKKQEKMLACIPAIQPVRNTDLKRAVSGFGYRIDPIYKTRHLHTGIDFTADTGTEVYATGDGVIEAIENKRWGYGKSVIIDHGFGYKTRYAHLSKYNVRVGQKVTRGELIGLIGSTGKSTGPHLHYEVVKDGVKVNPIGYFHSDLTPEQYEQLLQMSENSYRALD